MNEQASIKDIERFLSYISFTGNCWRWTAFTHKGYGQFSFKDSLVRAHRFAYSLFKGSIPDGKTLDHLCRNRDCVNPHHLEPVSPEENVMRGLGVTAHNKRKTHCKWGHEFNSANTGDVRIKKNGSIGRYCKTCQNRRAKEYNERKLS